MIRTSYLSLENDLKLIIIGVPRGAVDNISIGLLVPHTQKLII
jgi:hypothetical protein